MTTSFRQHCEQKGIVLLRDDILFIKEQLKHHHRDDHRAILSVYVDNWLKGMSSTDIVQLRANLGRYAANTYLRELVNGRSS